MRQVRNRKKRIKVPATQLDNGNKRRENTADFPQLAAQEKDTLKMMLKKMLCTAIHHTLVVSRVSHQISSKISIKPHYLDLGQIDQCIQTCCKQPRPSVSTENKLTEQIYPATPTMSSQAYTRPDFQCFVNYPSWNITAKKPQKVIQKIKKP